jgi:hypothetical protein
MELELADASRATGFTPPDRVTAHGRRLPRHRLQAIGTTCTWATGKPHTFPGVLRMLYWVGGVYSRQ